MSRTQRTFNVGEEKIKIVTTVAMHMQHISGYYVVINGYKQHIAKLERQEAEDIAYVNWVKKFH